MKINLLTIVCFTIIYTTIAVPLEFSKNEEGDLFEGDIVGAKIEYVKGAAVLVAKPNQLWPSGIVPYVIENGHFNASDLEIIDKGMRMLENQTKVNGNYCVKFIPHTTEANWVRLFKGVGCYSNIGKISGTGPQDISLDTSQTCFKYGSVSHELIHTLGFYHEQSRPDRDDFITVVFENIEPGKEDNFFKYSTGIDLLGLPYDYDSIMHYSSNGFSINGSATIIPKVSGVTIGQREKLSSIDVKEVQKYYNCV